MLKCLIIKHLHLVFICFLSSQLVYSGKISLKHKKTYSSKSYFQFFLADTNVCSSDLCMNGGTCEVQDDGNNFNCRCTDGFSGLRCESGKDIILTARRKMCNCTSLLIKTTRNKGYVCVSLF